MYLKFEDVYKVIEGKKFLILNNMDDFSKFILKEIDLSKIDLSENKYHNEIDIYYRDKLITSILDIYHIENNETMEKNIENIIRKFEKLYESNKNVELVICFKSNETFLIKDVYKFSIINDKEYAESLI